MFRTVKANLKRAANSISADSAAADLSTIGTLAYRQGERYFKKRLISRIPSKPGSRQPRMKSYRSSKTTARRISNLRKGMKNLKRSSGGGGRGGNSRKTKVGSKRAKVNPAFKRKVLKALEETEKSGQFHFIKGHAIESDAVNNQVTYWAGVGTIPNMALLGSPLQVLNIAAYLWNQKAFTETWTTTTGNFPEEDMHLHVTSQTQYLHLTNNTQRNFKVTFYECVARNDQTNSPLNDVDDELNADGWTAATPRPNRGAITFANVNETWAAGSGGTASNQGQSMRPEFLPGFRNNWKFTSTTSWIRPGRSKNYTVRIGDMTYKAEKYTEPDGTTYRYHRNMTKAYFFRMEPELSLAGPGAGADNDKVGMLRFSSAGPHFLLTTRTKIYMKMPTYTSNIDPAAAGGPVIASNKQDVYAFLNYLDLPDATPIISRLDPKIPTLYEGTAIATAYPS